MGIAGLLTSDLFDLPTALDAKTQGELDEKRRLIFKRNKTTEEKARLQELSKSLESLGFSMTTRDPLYNKFLERLYEYEKKQRRKSEELSREELSCLIDRLLNETMAGEG